MPDTAAILPANKLEELFEVPVVGAVSVELRLRGKPAPDAFTESARQLGVQPEKAAVFENALVGVEAGEAVGFALVGASTQ